ncbi:MAG TPA: alpha/beta hydrolase-fold protein [Verrucomicrobiae bacterium]|nr:alpha/beta hydrolase-fold protein [Verrucomicrobiae bacterium]
MFHRALTFLVVGILTSAIATHGQATNSTSTNRPARGPQGPRVVSPELSADGKVTFRVLAPKAESIKLSAGDIPGQPQGGVVFTKGASNVWEATIEKINPGAYRYNFNIDGVATIDPRNPLTSQSNENTWSLVVVPGSEYSDTKNVPHGAVAEVTYHSTSLNRARRMHVYTPPGYEKGGAEYPVFYLLHGASDSDASWSTVGRAGFILDNLIAAKKAKPMIVVMPHGHVGPGFGGRGNNDFEKDFSTDILPHIEKNYRVRKDRQSRAIAGLSMGGAQTLNIAFDHLDQFAYVGVYSSGVFGIGGPQQNSEPTWEERHKTALDNGDLKKDLKLVWFATGKDDFLLKTTEGTVEMLKKHKFDITYKETAGGHTWVNWREYLNEFAPQLFQ